MIYNMAFYEIVWLEVGRRGEVLQLELNIIALLDCNCQGGRRKK
jgi:hypothetical protein